MWYKRIDKEAFLQRPSAVIQEGLQRGVHDRPMIEQSSCAGLHDACGKKNENQGNRSEACTCVAALFLSHACYRREVGCELVCKQWVVSA
eukprot:scaffold134411_cov21-Tisochrysis_lutea.AAC.4